MGTVYRAKDLQVNRDVAIKVLHCLNEKAIKRFRREIRIAASVNHPLIVKVFHVGGQQVPYMVMEYIAGAPLGKYLRENDISIDGRLAILEKIARALHYAHQQNIIHRDIKPSNIMIRKSGEPVLMDFGLAKTTDIGDRSLTRTGEVLGTPHYMAPEQARGIKRELDARTDLYALGAVLYELLTGSPPAQGSNLMEIAQKVVYKYPPPPRTISPDIPQKVENICLKALQKNKIRRYQSAVEFADDIAHYLNGEDTVADAFLSKYRLLEIGKKSALVSAGLLLLFLTYLIFDHYRGQAKIDRMKARQDCLQAKEMCDHGEYKKALSLLKKAISRCEDLPEAHLQLALAYQSLDQPAKARKAFARAISLMPDNPAVLYQKSSFHLSQGEYEKARQLLNRYLALTPDARGYRKRAQALESLGLKKQARCDLEIAESLLEKKLQSALSVNSPALALAKVDDLVREYPDFAQGYLERAGLNYRLNDHHQALQDISRAIEIKPHRDYYLLKAQWLRQEGYLQDAYRCLLLASQKNNMPSPMLAEVTEELGKYKEAYGYYRSLKQGGDIELKMGRVAFKNNDFSHALAHLEKASKDSVLPAAARGEALYYAGCVYRQDRQFSKARKAWKKALKLGAPQLGDIHYRLGKIYEKHDSVGKALKHLRESARLSPDRVCVQAELGNYCLKKEKFEQARNAFSACIKLQPWEYGYYYRRGVCCRKLGEFDRAESDFSTCLKLRPGAVKPYVQIGDCVFQAGFLKNYRKIHLFTRTIAKTPLDTFDLDLFQEKRRELQEVLKASSGSAVLSSGWDEKKYEILVKGLMESDSPAVQQMAQSGLLSMCRESRLYEHLQRDYQRQSASQTQRRLKDVMLKAAMVYAADFRGYLIRYYACHDPGGLKEIYDKKEAGRQCLNSLLVDERENSMVRFWAALALRDLKEPEADAIIERGMRTGTVTTRLLCQIAGKYLDMPTPLDKAFLDAAKIDDPFIRAMAARYAPIKNVQVFLNDPDLKVRLESCLRLRKRGNRQAEKILVKNFCDSSPLVRAFCISAYWNMALAAAEINPRSYRALVKRTEKHLQKLMNATKDSDPVVRCVAIMNLPILKNGQNIPILEKGMTDSDQAVQLHSILGLIKAGELERAMPVLIDSKESFTIRIMAACKLRGYFNQFSPASAISAFDRMRRDKDPRIQIITLYQMGWTNLELIPCMLLQFSREKDEATKIGCILGMCNYGGTMFFGRLRKMLQDKSPKVRAFAASAIVYITCNNDISRMFPLCKEFKGKSKEMRRGAALGFVRLLHCRVLPPDRNYDVAWDWPNLYRLYLLNLIKAARNGKWAFREGKSRGIKTLADAIRCLSFSLELIPDNAIMWFERGVLQYLASEKIPGQRPDLYAKSIKDLEKAVEMQERPLFKKWLARLYKLNGEYQSKDYRKALQITRQLLDETPWDADLWQWRGEVFHALGEREKASAAFIRAQYLKKRTR